MASSNDIIKCVIVGDGAVGKTCMLISYTTNKFPEEYVPTVFDNYKATIHVGEKAYLLSLFDTAGQEEYDRLRPMTYPHTDIFLVAFSVVSRESFNNVKFKWIPELQHHCPGAAFILIGSKCDMRTSQGGNVVSTVEGQKMCAQLGGVCYLECSSKTREGLKEVFDKAIKHVGAHRKKTAPASRQNSGCCVVM